MVPEISLIIPCRNEQQYIGPLLNDLLSQTFPIEKMEVLVMDGMSTDGTRNLVNGVCANCPSIQLVDNPELTVPFALNKGIKMSKAEVVMILGSHSSYPVHYVQTLFDALMRTKADNVGGLLETLPADDTAEALAIALAMSGKIGVGNSLFRTGTDREMEVDTVPFGCYRKEVFSRIGYFDPKLTRNQDDELNGRLLKAGGRILLIPTVTAGYYARPTIAKLYDMFRQYGLYKPLVNRKLGGAVTARQFGPPAFVLYVFAWAVTFLIAPLLSLFIGLPMGAYLLILLGIGFEKALTHRRMNLAFYFPLAVISMHWAYGSGYLEGLLRFRLLRKEGGGDLSSSR